HEAHLELPGDEPEPSPAGEQRPREGTPRRTWESLDEPYVGSVSDDLQASASGDCDGPPGRQDPVRKDLVERAESRARAPGEPDEPRDVERARRSLAEACGHAGPPESVPARDSHHRHSVLRDPVVRRPDRRREDGHGIAPAPREARLGLDEVTRGVTRV